MTPDPKRSKVRPVLIFILSTALSAVIASLVAGWVNKKIFTEKSFIQAEYYLPTGAVTFFNAGETAATEVNLEIEYEKPIKQESVQVSVPIERKHLESICGKNKNIYSIYLPRLDVLSAKNKYFNKEETVSIINLDPDNKVQYINYSPKDRGVSISVILGKAIDEEGEDIE